MNSRASILLLNPEGAVVEMIHSIYGYDDTLAGRELADVMDPESALRFRLAVAAVVREPGKECEGEYRVRDAAGVWHSVRIHVQDRLDDPDLQAIVVNGRDVTENEAAANQIASLNAITESLDCAVVAVDLDGNIRSWNPAASRIYGFTAEEAAGRNISILSAPGQPDPETAQLRRKDGCIISVKLNILPLFSRDHHLLGSAHIAVPTA